MSDHYYQDEEEERSLSLRDAVNILKGSAGDYFAARRELLQMEAKEASQFLGKKLILALVLLILGFFTYVLFWGTLITMGAHYLEGSFGGLGEAIGDWPCVAILVIKLHILVLLILVAKLKKKADFELFSVTKSELQKDKQWLEENK